MNFFFLGVRKVAKNSVKGFEIMLYLERDVGSRYVLYFNLVRSSLLTFRFLLPFPSLFLHAFSALFIFCMALYDLFVSVLYIFLF